MNKKALIGIVAALGIGAFAAYTVAAPKPKDTAKIKGTIYVLPKQFTLNLADGRYATMTVALVLAPDQATGAGGGEGGATPPDGFGTLPEEPAVRDIVTNVVTNARSADLISASGRERLKAEIVAHIKAQTDVKVTGMLLTDVAVQ